MSAAVDTRGVRDLIAERYARVVDDATQAVLVDLNEKGPRSDDDNADGHMVDRVELAASEDSGTRLSRTIRSPADYSSFVDEGTSPHRIDGRPFLAFTAKDGTRVVVRYVNHPGTQRTGWWSDTVAKFGDYLQGSMP